jgi:hypothetical protein
MSLYSTSARVDGILPVTAKTMKHPPNFLVDAAQTAYLYSCRNFYGTRSAAVKALHKRKSAQGKELGECEQAFDIGLTVIDKTREVLSSMPPPEHLPDEDAQRFAESIVLEVRRALPDSRREMIDYAMGMLFWMPLMR